MKKELNKLPPHWSPNLKVQHATKNKGESDFITKLIDSSAKRLGKVLKNKGRIIDYWYKGTSQLPTHPYDFAASKSFFFFTYGPFNLNNGSRLIVVQPVISDEISAYLPAEYVF